MQLIPAVENDLPTLVSLVAAYHVFEEIPSSEQHIQTALQPLLLPDSPAGRLWLIEHQNATVGYVALCFGYSIEFGGRDAFIDELFIIESARHQGFGRQAVAQVVEEARNLGVLALHLEVDHNNTAAQNLYRKLGFDPRSRFQLMTHWI